MTSEAFKSNNGGLFDALSNNVVSGVGSTIASGLSSLSGGASHSGPANTSILSSSSNSGTVGGNVSTATANANSNTSSASNNASNLNVLKIINIPNDLSRREASTIFSLVIDDIISIDINDFAVWAYFKNSQTCLTTAKLLDGKCIFGKDFGPIKIDYECGGFKSTAASTSSLGASFNNLRLGQQANQRSRFLFGDPFLSSTTSHQPNLDLNDLSSQSFLMMDSHHDSIVRDPWNNQLPISSAPQTPGVSSQAHTPFDWNSHANSTSHGLVSGTANSNSHEQPQSQSQPQSQAERRRTSSAFFNNSLLPLGSNLPLNSMNSISLSSGPGINASPGLSGTNATSASGATNVQTSDSQNPGSNQNSTNGAAQTGQNAPKPGNVNAQGSQQSSQGSQSGMSPLLNLNTATSNSKKDVPDLSLLARVPPPANPADQNPPCNTLYVGNLPPDATELELRALFSPQKGFRRLSFRTKNLSLSNSGLGSNHSHGPMCFVEFEDVAHATRALAELYGRTLPRSGASNGKGGIRLSFSKNPLGVRGPGNPRRSSNNQMQNSNSSNSYGGIGNYGYLNCNK